MLAADVVAAPVAGAAELPAPLVAAARPPVAVAALTRKGKHSIREAHE